MAITCQERESPRERKGSNSNASSNVLAQSVSERSVRILGKEFEASHAEQPMAMTLVKPDDSRDSNGSNPSKQQPNNVPIPSKQQPQPQAQQQQQKKKKQSSSKPTSPSPPANPQSSQSAKLVLKQFLSMAKGDGEDSYARNSYLMHNTNTTMLSILTERLLRMSLPSSNSGPIVVADLGCASGPNTIHNVSFVIDTFRKRYEALGRASPEFQAYFNDLRSTDFNLTFHHLDLDSDSDSDSESRNFFAAGVPGDFYGRLFPRSSVTVFISSHALHWMSKIPTAVEDKDSDAFNRNRIWLHDSSPAVIEEYKKHKKEEMKKFLEARAQELVPGGLVCCIFGCADTKPPGLAECEADWLQPMSEEEQASPTRSIYRMMECAWDQLLAEGILTAEQRECINLPIFHLTGDELKEIVHGFSHAFTVDKVEQIIRVDDLVALLSPSEQDAYSKSLLQAVAAAMSPLFAVHIGDHLTRVFFARLHRIAFQNRKPGTPPLKLMNLQYILMLTRK